MIDYDDDDTDLGGMIRGARRLQELQQCSIFGFQYDTVCMTLEYGVDMRLLVEFNNAVIGWWTRTRKGMMVAHFGQAELFSTCVVDEAYAHTVEMARKRQRRRA